MRHTGLRNGRGGRLDGLVDTTTCNADGRQLTFFDTILLGLAIVLDLTRDALNALFVVMLGSGARLGLCALCSSTD